MAPEPEPLALVAGACEAGLGLADPVGFRIVEALARRTAVQQGPARRALDQRLGQRLDALQAAVRSNHPSGGPGGASPRAESRASAPSDVLQDLRGLVTRLGGQAAQTLSAPGAASLSAAVMPPPALKAVTAHKGTWSRLRAEQRLRQALDQVPSMAGPLHSSQVVHRALQSIHALSPAYLEAFMAHVDALLWLEQATGGDLPRRMATRGKAGKPAGTGSR